MASPEARDLKPWVCQGVTRCSCGLHQGKTPQQQKRGTTLLSADGFVVLCARCERETRFQATLDLKKQRVGRLLSRLLMAAGYLFLRPEGWVCPSCAREPWPR